MPNRTCTYLDPHNLLCCSECGRSLDLCVCVNPDAIAHERLTSHDGLVIRMIRDELVAARTKFPDNVHQFDALVEEVGELAKGLMEHDRALGTTTQQVLREAVQVGCMAIRVAVEGDADYVYAFPAVEEDLPKGPVADRF